MPNRIRTICPALIFAASRKDRVNGREEVLVVSTSERKGLSHCGVPWGTSLARVAGASKLSEDRIYLNQRGSPSLAV